jgi:hypothetical protein
MTMPIIIYGKMHCVVFYDQDLAETVTTVAYTLIHRAWRLCDADSLDKEIQHLKETLKKMATATRISDGLSKKRLNPVQSMRSRLPPLGFPTKGPPHTRSADCWPNSTSRPYIFRPRTSIYSGWSKTSWA